MNTLKILIDTDADNPRSWDNLGILALARTNAGDTCISDPIDFLEELLGLSPKGEYSNSRLEQLEKRLYKEYIALPVYKYEHSGVAYATAPFGCRWDSGKAGYIYVEKKTALEELEGGKIVTASFRTKVERHLSNEVNTFSKWANGDVYGFRIEDEDNNEVDSCYGFYSLEDIADGIDSKDLGLSTYDEVLELINSLELN